jgi:hypothetical protein
MTLGELACARRRRIEFERADGTTQATEVGTIAQTSSNHPNVVSIILGKRGSPEARKSIQNPLRLSRSTVSLRESLAGVSCGSLLRESLVAISCGNLLRESLVAISCGNLRSTALLRKAKQFWRRDTMCDRIWNDESHNYSWFAHEALGTDPDPSHRHLPSI